MQSRESAINSSRKKVHSPFLPPPPFFFFQEISILLKLIYSLVYLRFTCMLPFPANKCCMSYGTLSSPIHCFLSCKNQGCFELESHDKMDGNYTAQRVMREMTLLQGILFPLDSIGQKSHLKFHGIYSDLTSVNLNNYFQSFTKFFKVFKVFSKALVLS